MAYVAFDPYQGCTWLLSKYMNPSEHPGKQRTYHSEEAYREGKGSAAYRVQAYMLQAVQEAPFPASYAEGASLYVNTVINSQTYRRLIPVRRISVYVSTGSGGLSRSIFFVRRRRDRRVDWCYHMRRRLLRRRVRNRRIGLHISLAMIWPLRGFHVFHESMNEDRGNINIQTWEASTTLLSLKGLKSSLTCTGVLFLMGRPKNGLVGAGVCKRASAVSPVIR